MSSREDIVTQVASLCSLLGQLPRDVFADASGIPLSVGSERFESAERREFLTKVVRELDSLNEILRSHGGLLRYPGTSQPESKPESSQRRKVLIEEIPATEELQTPEPEIDTVQVLHACTVYTQSIAIPLTSQEASESAHRVVEQLLSSLQSKASRSSAPGKNAALLSLLPACGRLLKQDTQQRQSVRSSLSIDSGPDTYRRALGAARAAGLLQCLGKAHSLAEAFPVVIPIVLAFSDDTSPAVRETGLAALDYLLRGVPVSVLRPQRELLLHEATKSLEMAEERTWAAAARMATHAVCSVEGRDVFGTGYSSALDILLGREAALSTNPDMRLPWFGACRAFVQAMGVASAAFHGRLLPVLVEWATASEEACRVAALEALLALTRSCWPRLGLHGNKLVVYLKERSVEPQSERELELQEVVFGALKEAGSAVRVG